MGDDIMRHAICTALLLALPVAMAAEGAAAATLPGTVTAASGATTLTVDEAGTLTLTASASDGTQAVDYFTTTSQLSLSATFDGVGGGSIFSAIGEGDTPETYQLSATFVRFGGYTGGSTYRTFRATFLTPFDAVTPPTLQEVLDVLNGGLFTFRIGNDVTNGPDGPDANYFETAEGGPVPAPVALPGGAALMVAGLGALAVARHKRA